MYTLKVKIIETQNKLKFKEKLQKGKDMSARFCGTGSCVPDYVMDNDGVAELVETSDSWIRERTGIARRHIAVKETTVSMANEAAKRALDNAGVLPEELDLILNVHDFFGCHYSMWRMRSAKGHWCRQSSLF